MILDRARWRGEIEYLGAGGDVTGCEAFTVSVHGDGSRTLNAHCVMDDLGLVRDVVLALTPDERPAEAFVRIVEDGRHSGSWWERFDDPPPFFGTHALVNDGWLALLGLGMAVGEARHLEGLLTCSLAADGGGAPQRRETSARLERLDDEHLAVPAGAFDCRRWRVAYGEHPPLDMWVAGPLDLLVAMQWPHLGTRYELVALERLR